MFLGPRSYRRSLEEQSVPGFDLFVPPGLQLAQGQPRQPDSVDEAQSFVKYAIAKMEYRRLRLIQETYEREGHQISPGALPDVLKPLRDLTRFLLPHLEFERIDIADERNVRCLFRRVDGDAIDSIDIDDLSSGEKALVALFLPFLETQIDVLLGDVDGADAEAPLPTALIDEPELHLHPVLQTSLVAYIRSLTESGEAQFILTTHSPTLLDALKDDELFLLAPLTIVGDGNQFVRVSSSEERLEAIRDLTGSTYLVTRCRPLVYLEGERPSGTKQAADQRLVELLIPAASSWVLVAARGRAQAIASATRLREAATEGLPGIPVFALVDLDQAVGVDPDYAIRWPVAMIENLLLDADAIWELLSPHRERIDLGSREEVHEALRQIARALRVDEVRLRVQGELGPVCVRVDVTDATAVGDALGAARAEFSERLEALGGGAAAIEALTAHAAEVVDRILEEGRELEAFRGKEILRGFYDQHQIGRIFPYAVFAYEVARRAAPKQRVRELTDTAVARIQRYVPRDLVPTLEAAIERLEELGDPTARLAGEARQYAAIARERWEAGQPDDVDRPRLREMLVHVARALRNHAEENLHTAILQSAVQVGLGDSVDAVF
jgi:hypothetical protein